MLVKDLVPHRPGRTLGVATAIAVAAVGIGAQASVAAAIPSHLGPAPAGATSSGHLFAYPQAYEKYPVPLPKPLSLESGDLASCKHLAWKPGKPLHVVYVPPSTQYPYYQAIGVGLKKVIQHYGGTFSEQAPTVDEVSQQLPILRDVVQSHPTAIVFNTDSGTAAAPILKQAEKAGIPVIQINSDERTFATAVQGIVGYSEFQTDYIIGRYAVKLAKGRSTDVGVLTGSPSWFSTQRVAGFEAGIAHAKNMHIVSTLNGDWTSAGSESATLNMLQAHPSVKMMFGANDYEIYGAYQAEKSLHKTGIALFGSDGDTTAGLVPLADGQITATMNTFPYIQGLTAGQIVWNCLNNANFKGGWFQTPGVLTTSSNIQKLMSHPGLLYPKPTNYRHKG